MYDGRVNLISAEELITKIDDVARSEPGGVLAFDGDGTIWSGDIGDDFFEALVLRDDLHDDARGRLSAQAKEAGLPSEGTAPVLARTLHTAYLDGRYSEERMYETMAWLGAGWAGSRLEEVARTVMEGLVLEKRLHDETVSIIRWARGHGVEVFIVSASPRVIVREGARQVGIDHEHVVAATEQRDGEDRVLPRIHAPIPYNDGKVSRLRERIGDRPLYAAFGDNTFDVPMLKEARHAVAVRPKPRLLARVAEVPGIVELARR